MLSYWHTDIDHMVVWGIPSALVVAGVTLAKAPLKSGPLARGVSFLGDASYSLYLVHPIAVTVPRRLLGPYLNAAAPLHAVLLLAFAIAAACMVHVVFERPLTRYLQDRIAAGFSRRSAAPGRTAQPAPSSPP